MGFFSKFLPSKKCNTCDNDATDKLDDVRYCREHLVESYKALVAGYAHPLVVLEPETLEDGSYVPYLNFWDKEVIETMVGKAQADQVKSLLDTIRQKECSVCAKNATALYITNDVFKEAFIPDFADLTNYASVFFCNNHITEKLVSIIQKTSHAYGEGGDIGIVPPFGVGGGLIASSIYN